MKKHDTPRRKRIIFLSVLSILLLLLPGLLTLSGQSRKGRKIFPYGVLDYSKGKNSGGQTKTIVKKYQPPAGKVLFVNQESNLLFNVKIGYNKIAYIHVANRDQVVHEIKVEVKSPAILAMGINGPGGESFVKIPAQRSISLPVKIFTQDAKEGLYDFSANLIDVSGKLVHKTNGQVYIEGPEMNISVTKIRERGLLHEYEITNKGEELGNFSLKLKGAPGIAMNPRVQHYLFPSGKTLKVALYPTGKTAGEARGQISAQSAGVELDFPFKIKAPAGQNVELISLDPIVRLRRKDWYCTNRPIIHLDFNVPYVQKEAVQDVGFTAKFTWLKTRGKGFDSNRNGKKDHWELVEKGRVLMTGDDYNGDGKIDFFRESDSKKRSLNRAFVKIKRRWYATNIVDAYLVSSFLPMTDAVKLKPHDVDVLLNKKLLSRRKKIIPRGSSVTRIRLDYLAENNRGFSANRITVSTKHLRKSSYQVSAENTLVLHYSSIKIPVLTRKSLKLDTSPYDKDIRKKEQEISRETSEVKKELMVSQLKEIKTQRDKMLKKSEEFIEKNKNQGALKLSGVQYRGLDLALYASELKRRGKKLKGVVRNMGYSRSGYRVTVFSSRKGSKPKKIISKKFPALPPFARRTFNLALPGYNRRKRTVYRVTVNATRRKKELVMSNNTAHLVSGPPPDTETLRSEMKLMAAEMGLHEDKVTLSRKAPLPVYYPAYSYGRSTTITKTVFSAPLVRMEKDAEVFILD